ncbi:MAG: regulatory protein RecX [Caldilineaceae bacterium]
MAGTITRMAVQKQNRERVSIFLDGEYAFSIEIMAATLLRRGQQLSDAEIAQLQGHDTRTRAYLAAVRLLGVRPRSRVEIERALQGKEHDADAVGWAVERLQREQLLDDAGFARFWSENRSQFRPRSSRAIRYELRQKGVANDDMAEALEAVDDDEAAWAAVQSRLGQFQSLPVEEARQKLYGFLGRRGFSFETSRRVWKRMEAGEESAADPAAEDGAE